MWTKNFQMYKLDSKKAEEPEIKLQISVRSYKKQGIFFFLINFFFTDYDYGDHNKLENS